MWQLKDIRREATDEFELIGVEDLKDFKLGEFKELDGLYFKLTVDAYGNGVKTEVVEVAGTRAIVMQRRGAVAFAESRGPEFPTTIEILFKSNEIQRLELFAQGQDSWNGLVFYDGNGNNLGGGERLPGNWHRCELPNNKQHIKKVELNYLPGYGALSVLSSFYMWSRK